VSEFKCKKPGCDFGFYNDMSNPDGGLWPGGHFAKRVCGLCGTFWGWAPKPDGDKFKRPASHRDLVKKFGQGFCELCLRTKEQLRNGDTFEGHHIQEYAEEGEPKAENILIVCTACHRLINWLRTYHGTTCEQ